MRKNAGVALAVCLLMMLPSAGFAQTPVEDKVAVLITAWGQPTRYVFEYSWENHYWARVGDTTEYEGEPCKIGHVGDFYDADGDGIKEYSQLSHLGIMPWGLNHIYPGWDYTYDRGGYYKYDAGTETYISIHPDGPALAASAVSPFWNVIPAVEVTDTMTGSLQFPPDPRTGEDLLAGWFKIESTTMSGDGRFANGLGDMYELNNLIFIHYYKLMGLETEPWTASAVADVHLFYEDKMAATINQLETAFGDQVDVRDGYYTAVPGYTQHEVDVAKNFAQEGYRKMLASRETTDNNHYANNFITGNYIKEALCEEGALDDTEFYQVRQIGRTPEYNAMNIEHVRPYIEAYPEGSTIALIYVTHGLSWPGKESYGFMGIQHPWWKEVIHENSFLNYLSWRDALEEAYGNRYNLIFSRENSRMLADSFYAYGYLTPDKLDGKFFIIRDAIQMVKDAGLDKMIIVPGHWHGDAQDTQYIMRKNSNLPLVPLEDMQAGNFELTYCEGAAAGQVDCNAQEAVAEITITPSYNDLTDEFATVYTVRLRGGLERFGVYPTAESFGDYVKQLITKRDGGTLAISSPGSSVFGAEIKIPADPYPDYPESFTPDTAIAFSDPDNTFECMWEDAEIIIRHRTNPPALNDGLTAAGPAVHFGPYRMLFNRDVTMIIPYDNREVGSETLGVYVYNHLTGKWENIQAESFVNGLATFKTKYLGLFQVAAQQATGTPSCSLSVKHKRIYAQKLTKPRKVVLNITGEDGFDVFGAIDLGPLTWNKVKVKSKKNRLRIMATVPANLGAGTIPISVGECSGEIEIVDKAEN